MDAAIELDRYSGYLDTAEQKQANEAKGRYAALLLSFADDAIRSEGSGDAAIAMVQRDMAEMRAASNEVHHGLYYNVAEDLEAVIRREAGRRPWFRKMRINAAIIFVGLLAIVYVSVRLYSLLPIDQPLNSRAGIVQRAAALDKALAYDDIMRTRSIRGNAIKPILYWPIEPTETEAKAAGELIALTFSAAGYARQARLACNLPMPGETITDADITLLAKVTAYLRDPQVRWANPVPQTVLAAVQAGYPCPAP